MSDHSRRVVTPRAVWPSMSGLAHVLGCAPNALYPYVERRGRVYHLRPLNETAYARWHRTVYRRKESTP